MFFSCEEMDCLSFVPDDFVVCFHCHVMWLNCRRSDEKNLHVLGIVWQFGSYTYLYSCRKLVKNIDTNFCPLRLQPADS